MRIISKIKNRIKEILFRLQLKRVYAADSKYQLRYLRGQCKDCEDKLDADIMLEQSPNMLASESFIS